MQPAVIASGTLHEAITLFSLLGGALIMFGINMVNKSQPSNTSPCLIKVIAAFRGQIETNEGDQPSDQYVVV
jgi:hypothetical protein